MTSSQLSNVQVTITVTCLNFAVYRVAIVLHPLSSSRRVKPSRKIALNSNGEVNCRELARRPWAIQGSTLTLKWSRPSALPLVVKGGGSLWTLTQKSTFPNEFGGEMWATDKVIQKNQNTAKKSKIGIYAITKWRPKNPISISRHKISDQKKENHFPEGIFP